MKITKEYLKDLYARHVDACEQYINVKHANCRNVYIDTDVPFEMSSSEIKFVITDCGSVPVDALLSDDPAEYAKEELAKAKKLAEQSKARAKEIAKEHRRKEYLKLKEEFGE